MKTSLIVKDWNDRLSRAALPGDAADQFYALRYQAAHTVEGTRERGGKTSKKWREPEGVTVRNNVFRPKGGKLERIRKMPQEQVAALEAIDAERDRLKAEIEKLDSRQNALLAATYEKSEPLRMHEIRGFKNMEIDA